MVDECQDVLAAAPKGAAELGELFEAGGHTAADDAINLLIACLLRRR